MFLRLRAYSEQDLGLYIGYSTDLRRRSTEHKDGASQATSHRGPWSLIYYQAYVEDADAIGRERYLKKWRRQKAFTIATSQLFYQAPSSNRVRRSLLRARSDWIRRSFAA
jgi:Predicted endonuclease containing a URI domain